MAGPDVKIKLRPRVLPAPPLPAAARLEELDELEELEVEPFEPFEPPPTEASVVDVASPEVEAAPAEAPIVEWMPEAPEPDSEPALFGEPALFDVAPLETGLVETGLVEPEPVEEPPLDTPPVAPPPSLFDDAPFAPSTLPPPLPPVPIRGRPEPLRARTPRAPVVEPPPPLVRAEPISPLPPILRRRSPFGLLVALLAVVALVAGVTFLVYEGLDDNEVATTPESTSSSTASTSTTAATSTTSTSTTAPVSTTLVPLPTTIRPTSPSRGPTTTLCTDNTNPSCGPFRYVPDAGPNAPMRITISVTPENPHVGDLVLVTVRFEDADSPPSANCRSLSSGEGAPITDPCEETKCPVRYGAAAPPQKVGGFVEVQFDHRYEAAGDFVISVRGESADQCGPYGSRASATRTITVLPPAETTTTV